MLKFKKGKQKKLEQLVNGLTTEGRIHFLTQAYTPGNIEIADLLIGEVNQREFPYDFGPVEIALKEADFALEAGNHERVKQMYLTAIKRSSHSRIKEIVKKANNETVTQEALKILERGGYESIETAANICYSIGDNKKGREYLEKAFKAAKGKDGDYASRRILLRLGRHQEALELALEGNSWEEGIKIARKYFPQRVEEVIDHFMNKYIEKKWWDWVAKIADHVGRKEEAELYFDKALRREDSKYEMPHYHFYDLAQTAGYMKNVPKGHLNAWQLAVAKEIKELEEPDFHKKWHTEKHKVLKRIVNMCDEAYKQTGSQEFLKYTIEPLEQLGRFDEAYKVCQQLGLEGKAKLYQFVLSNFTRCGISKIK